MKRSTIVIFAGLAMAVGVAAFGTEVIAPDGTVLSDVRTVPARDGTTWVRIGLGAPVAVTPNAENQLQVPGLAQAGYLVQDAVSGEPIEEGSLSWQLAGVPEDLANATWRRSGGILDLACRGDERIIFSAPGYAHTTVRVTADGRVIAAGKDGRYGRTVVVDHGGGYRTRYAHLKKIDTSEGRRVHRGDRIGRVGKSGNASGAHLHYEVLINGVPVNPRPYLE